MKGFLQWFKSSAKMKRWMLLILVGIILACYGMAQVLVYDVVDATVIAIGKIVVTFVIGFTCIILGLIFLNKRTLEVLVESTDDRMVNKKNVNVKSLIFNKTIYDEGPNIVVIGGGSGLNTVLSGIKNYTKNITAIVTVSNYGEEMSNSRKELKTLPIDDIKDSMIALNVHDGELEKLFNHNFSEGKLRGLSFADIYFLAMQEINKDFSDAIIKSNQILNIVGKVLPVTLDEMQISAELNNGYVVNEKSRISEIVTEKFTKINRVYITPSNCKAAPGVLDVIRNADSIIIGPGSLYTNVIPNLLVSGVARAIKESKAIKIYVSNIMTEQGQTDDYSVADHINAIIEHCGEGLIDYCIYDTGEVIPEYVKKYNREGADLVEQNIEDVKSKGIKFIHKNISMIADDKIRHDAGLIGSSVIELICNDLKYQDKQNDPQYMLLNSKLQSDKRLNKIKTKQARNNKRQEKKPTKFAKKSKGKQSKFSSKYEERIKSIKESDKKIKEKERKLKDTDKKVSTKKEKTKEEKANETYERMSEFRKSGYKKNG